MRPPGVPGGCVCHVLLVEAESGLVLVDSGFGLRDAKDPAKRFGPARRFIRPAFAEAESAVSQVVELGLDPRDVRDIVLTHFDADHTGGLADFPWARIHLTAAEQAAALEPAGVVERGRYLPAQRDHGPDLVAHTPSAGDTWRGFAAAEELIAGVVLIALPGHTRGHAAVAVDAGEHRVLHVGDAFYHRGQIDGTGGVPWPLRAMERMFAHDWRQVRANHERLRSLWAADDPGLVLVNAHDPELLRAAQVGGSTRRGRRSE